MQEQDAEKLQELKKTFFLEKISPHLERIEQVLERNGGYLVGKSVQYFMNSIIKDFILI